MSDYYLVKFGPRVKRLTVLHDGVVPFKLSLEQAIRKAMLGDPFMKEHASSGFFLTQPAAVGGVCVEIDEHTSFFEVDNNVPIEIMLHTSISFDIPVHAGPNSAPSPAPSLAPTNPVANYMERLGLCVHKDPQPALQQPAPQQPAPQPAPQPSVPSTSTQKKTRAPSPDGEYLERVMRRRAENQEVIRRLIPSEAPKLKPATRKQRKKKGKENVEPRVMPRRGAKEKAPKQIEQSLSDKEEEMLADPAAPVLAEKRPQVVQIKVVGNFHKKKDHRHIGQVITKFTPLPEFPKKLKETLEGGVYDTKQMNQFLKNHVESVTGNTRLSKEEYNTLGQQVANRLESMNLAHSDTYIVKIKKHLSNCLRSARYYPRKRELRKAAAAAKERDRQVTTDQNMSPEVSTANRQDEADVILQKPVVNRASVRMCIGASTARIPFIKTHRVEEVLMKYPYLKEADLLIYEYSLRIPLPLRTLQENFTNSLSPLSHILDVSLPNNEADKIIIFHLIERFYCGEENHLPSIQFCDAVNKNAVPLNEIPAGQAPAVVILKDDIELLSATLIFDGAILTTAQMPTAFDCVALLLSGYWVFHIDYPGPYRQHMESIEAILHGKVPEKNITRYPRKDEFFRKLIIAMN